MIKVGRQGFSSDKKYQKVTSEEEGDLNLGAIKNGAPNEMGIHQELEIS